MSQNKLRLDKAMLTPFLRSKDLDGAADDEAAKAADDGAADDEANKATDDGAADEGAAENRGTVDAKDCGATQITENNSQEEEGKADDEAVKGKTAKSRLGRGCCTVH